MRRSRQAAVEDDLDLPAVLHRLGDGLLHIDDVPRTVGDHPPEPLQRLAHLELRQGSLLAVVLVPPLHRHLDGRLVPGGAADAHPARMMARMADGGGSARPDPAVPAVVGLLLILQPVEEVPDQLLRRESGELLLVEAERLRHLPRILQPLLEERLGDVGELDIFHLLDRRPLEIVGKDLIVGIEVPFALDENGTGRRVEVVQGADQAQGEGLLQAEKGGGGDGDPPFAEHIEEADKHGSLPPLPAGAPRLLEREVQIHALLEEHPEIGDLAAVERSSRSKSGSHWRARTQLISSRVAGFFSIPRNSRRR